MLNFLESIRQEKCKETTAENGVLGLKAAEDISFDLIIGDVKMPEMDLNRGVYNFENINISELTLTILLL